MLLPGRVSASARRAGSPQLPWRPAAPPDAPLKQARGAQPGIQAAGSAKRFLLRAQLAALPGAADLVELSDEDLKELGCKPLQARESWAAPWVNLDACLKNQPGLTRARHSRGLECRFPGADLSSACLLQARKIRNALTAMGFKTSASGEVPAAAPAAPAPATAAPAPAPAAAPGAAPASASAVAAPATAGAPAGYPPPSAAGYPPAPGYGAPPAQPYYGGKHRCSALHAQIPSAAPLPASCPGCSRVLPRPQLPRRPRLLRSRTTPARRWRRRCCSHAPTA